MNKFLILILCTTVTITFNQPSYAQRLIPNQKGIEFVGSIPLIKGEKFFTRNHFGLGMSLTHYFKYANYAFLSAEYEQQTLSYRTYNIPMRDILLQVGYMQPILSDRGKNIFSYLGFSTLCGYEELNKEKKLLPDGATLLDLSHFVYGGSIHSSIEIFLMDNLLFVLRAQGRFLFNSDLHYFRPALSVGFKFNF